MARKAQGSIRWRNGKPVAVRVTHLDKSRQLVPIRPEQLARPGFVCGTQAEPSAALLELGALISDQVRATRAVQAGTPVTVTEWSELWLAERAARNLSSVPSDRSRIRTHVQPAIGRLAMAEVAKERLEALVTTIDTKVRAEEMSWKNASNVWGLVSKMFSDAQSSKQKDLRVRGDNPTAGVRGPDRGGRKAKQYLYPSEFQTLVSCATVPLRWRVLYALSVYTYTRAGELEALLWEDVDLEHGVIHITKALDRDSKRVKTTKTQETRRIPIEPALMALLTHLQKGTETTAHVVVMPPDEIRATSMRKHLKRAGVKRAALYVNDLTRKQITFHDLRATGLTWMAMRGDDPLRIMQRAGHADFKTTQGYIREAENLSAGFGLPFPELPPELLKYQSAPQKAQSAPNHAFLRGIWRREGDSNPGQNEAEELPIQPKLPTAVPTPAGPSADSPVPESASRDAVEDALADAITKAAAAGRFDVVAQLAREIEARRTARAGNVVALRPSHRERS